MVLSDPSSSTTFAEATAVKPLSSHTYSGYFAKEWVIGNVPHGGVVTSVFLRVASAHFTTTLAHLNQPQTTTLHLTFVRRTRIGPAIFTVRDVKLGRGTSTIHITLRQPEENHEGEGEELVVGYITHTGVSVSPGLSYKTSWSLSPPTPPLDLSTLQLSSHKSTLTPTQKLLTSPNWAESPHLQFSEFRKASSRCRFLFPRQGQTGAGFIDQWVSLRSGERWDNESLGFVVDMFPQVVESLDVPGIYDLPPELASSRSATSSPSSTAPSPSYGSESVSLPSSSSPGLSTAPTSSSGNTTANSALPPLPSAPESASSPSASSPPSSGALSPSYGSEPASGLSSSTPPSSTSLPSSYGNNTPNAALPPLPSPSESTSSSSSTSLDSSYGNATSTPARPPLPTPQQNKKEAPKSAKYWYPTVLLNLDVKKPLPSPPTSASPTWLFVRVQAKQVKDGKYDLEVVVLDEAGDLVALSHHVCLVLSAGRNLKRSEKKVKQEGGGGIGKSAKL